MRHLVVLAAALLLAGLVGALTLGLGRAAADERLRVTAVFWPGTAGEAIMVAVARADGRVIRGTLLPFAVEVSGDRPGIAGRLEASGAVVVIAELPAHGLALGGCSYLSPAAYAGIVRQPGAVKPWAGPL
jgi:hypothetical protein